MCKKEAVNLDDKYNLLISKDIGEILIKHE